MVNGIAIDLFDFQEKAPAFSNVPLVSFARAVSVWGSRGM